MGALHNFIVSKRKRSRKTAVAPAPATPGKRQPLEPSPALRPVSYKDALLTQRYPVPQYPAAPAAAAATVPAPGLARVDTPRPTPTPAPQRPLMSPLPVDEQQARLSTPPREAAPAPVNTTAPAASTPPKSAPTAPLPDNSNALIVAHDGAGKKRPSPIARFRVGAKRRIAVLRARLAVLRPRFRRGKKMKPVEKVLAAPALSKRKSLGARRTLPCVQQRRDRSLAEKNTGLQTIPEPDTLQVEGFPMLHAHEDIETFDLMQTKLQLVSLSIERCLSMLSRPIVVT